MQVMELLQAATADGNAEFEGCQVSDWPMTAAFAGALAGLFVQ
jgi:hypothetical protein